MKYSEFKNSVLNFPLIASKDIAMFKSNKQAIRNQLRRWQDKKLIIKLKKGLYILNVYDRKINPSKYFIANQLYSPSYVSLEYAFNFYGLIPEKVTQATSVTTKKTAHFTSDFGVFTYRHIQPTAFRGFRAQKDESGLTFLIAEPEKAVIDFIYLNLSRFKDYDEDIFRDSYRFQNIEALSQRKIKEFANIFNNDRLTKLAALFCRFIKGEKRK